ncbi:MAG: hypothetical protein WD904_02170 [Dehalococcoidia bacterium]
MASKEHMATPEDDARHTPGPESRPLWNESYWFAWYDPKQEIGVAARFGMLPNKGYANLYILITHQGSLVYSMIDQRAALPPFEAGRVSTDGYTIEFEKPLDRFRLSYDRDGNGFDVTWEGYSPTCMWPHPPAPVDAVPRHIEHAGRVRGKVMIGAIEYAIDCLSRRDHSFGGERDWNRIAPWDYMSGEIDEKFWFNAAKIQIAGMPQPVTVGCLFDGEEVMLTTKVEADVKLDETGIRQTGVDLRITDEKGREHYIVGEVPACANVWFGPTCLREGFAKWTYGERVGYGIHEHGYKESGD